MPPRVFLSVPSMSESDGLALKNLSLVIMEFLSEHWLQLGRGHTLSERRFIGKSSFKPAAPRSGRCGNPGGAKNVKRRGEDLPTHEDREK